MGKALMLSHSLKYKQFMCKVILWEYWPDTLEYITWTNALQNR